MAFDRLEVNRDRRRVYPPSSARSVALETALGPLFAEVDVAMLLAHPQLAELERELSERMSHSGTATPYPPFYNASLAYARACWIACQVTKPAIVVETGVAAGFSTSFILHSLEVSGGGVLHSIDVHPFDVRDRDVAWLVPSELRNRWVFHRARSRRRLPPLLREVGEVDVFSHDGLHTLETMRFELRLGGELCDRPGVSCAMTRG